MDASEEKKTLQEDELQAIVAIYHNVADLREKDVWKISRPPEVLVECKPQSSDSSGAAEEHYVSLKLRIMLTKEYPDECPTIDVMEPVGLSEKQVKELLQKLQGLCKHLIGQEMMFELINSTQSYLYANNKPPPKSFYDQMITNNQKEVEEKTRHAEEAMKLKQIEEDLEIETELERQQSEIKEENRKRRQARHVSESEDRQGATGAATSRYHSKSPRRHNDSTSSNESQAHRIPSTKSLSTCPSDHSSVKDLSFTMSKTPYQVIRGQCAYHDPAGNTIFSALDKNSGAPVSVRHWLFDFTKSKVSKDDNLVKCRKLLSAAEQDLAKLLKIQDSNLIHYFSMQIITEGAKIYVMVLTECRNGITLSECVNLPNKIDSHFVQLISIQLVNSLVFLHSKQIVHKDIKPTVVYIHNSTVKLADYGLYRRLNEIQQAAVSGNMDSTGGVKRGQKEDVFRLGMTILFIVTSKFNEDERLPTIPSETNRELKEFLSKCFVADEKTRWSAVQLSDHVFLKPREKSMSSSSRAIPEDDNKEKSDEEEDQDANLEAVILRDTSGASRLANEFQLLGVIGEGGFGQVLKVRNSLDRCLYAIKKITLNSKSKSLNKRITREVKLLSRLNHENVVRYYNSWIETSEEIAETETDTSTEAPTTTTGASDNKSSVFFSDNIEDNAPGMVEKSVLWSTTSSEHNSLSYSPSSDDDSSDFGDFFGHSFMPHIDSDSEDVVFEESGVSTQPNESEDSVVTKVKRVAPRAPAPQLHTQFMYIQMEYCEKNTLRQAIDSGLHENMDRVWRLFREIIEGLVHLHEQGMIHRDLKPVNIFLDVNDHVKIGDFGLATTAFIAKQLPEEGLGAMLDMPTVDMSISQSMSVGDDRHTGRVGTLLYVSPEIKSCHGKTAYSQKVDIYSLGIIFFEMCYRPVTTMMERDRIIGSLRRPDITLPDDFSCDQNSKQVAILRWVLEHDPSKRPSSSELLQSDCLPRMEEEEIHEIFRSMLVNPQTRGYKKLMSTIFSQPLSRKFDFLYDYDVHKGINMSQLTCRQKVRKRLESVFTRHGAVELNLPLMLPKLSMYESSTNNVTFMDHAGNLVSLPYDLRVPFARYAARNNIASLKRYSLSRVFRERKPHGIQPDEHYLCAFDIIAPFKDSLVPDAEVLSVIQQILNEFPYLQTRGYTIHMNHSLLMTAILLYSGLPLQQHSQVLTALLEPKSGDKSKTSAYSCLQDLSINDQTSTLICTFMEMSGSYSAVSAYLKRITKSGQQAGSMVKTALHEIDSLITYITALGVTMPVLINLGFIYDIQHSSGVMYQIAATSSSTKHKSCLDVIAGGYRYDKLVSKFKRTVNDEPAAVGMSFLYDKLVYAMWQEKEETSLVSLVLYCVGKSAIQKEWLKLAQEFWSHGINTEILSDSTMDIEKVEQYCKDSGIKYVVTLSDYDPGQAKMKVIGSLVEKRFNITDILEEMMKRLNPPAVKDANRFQQGDHSNAPSLVIPNPEKSDRGSEPHTFQSNLPISIIHPHERPTLKARSKMETIVHNHLNNTVLALLKKSSEAEVVAFDLGLAEVKVLANAFIDSEDEEQFDHNCNMAMERQGSAKNRKYMLRIVGRLRQVKFQSNRPPVVIVYGLKDNTYRVIMG